MNVGECAHAGGEVDRGTAVGDVDLAPGSMHTEKDKRVGGSISLILAVVALDVAWVGRDWLPHLADELGWAFVETDYRVLGIGGFGIEIELILRAPTYSPSTCGMHHMFLAPRLEGVFGQPPAHSLTGDTVVRDEPDEFTRQQQAFSGRGTAGTAPAWESRVV